MKYIDTTDDSISEIKRFKSFYTVIYINMNITKRWRPRANQLGRFFATAETHKFESVSDITLEELKLSPIIDQTGTYIYKASKVKAKYLGPLAKTIIQ